MPGEIFQLDNIVEEPGSGSQTQDAARGSGTKSSQAAGRASGSQTQAAAMSSGSQTQAAARTIARAGEDNLDQSIGSSTGHQLETSLTSNISIPLSDSSAKVVIICFL